MSPIQSIQIAAGKIGSGALDQRIKVSSRDELGALAEEFNRMAGQLEASYSGLEHQVQDRTRELTSALSRLDEQARELEAVSQHKSQFLANMSHELRTPLNAISGFSQVLRKQLYGEINEKQAEYLDDILASARHLELLIDDVLDLSKVEAGRIELQLAPFSLPAALDRGVVIVRERATKEGVQILLSSAPGTNTVIGDERRVRQVIFNLLSNAVKFTPAGGTVDVAVAQKSMGRCAFPSATAGLGSPRKTRYGSSRNSSRPLRARSSAREPGSGWRCRSAWSSCTMGASGSKASRGREACLCSHYLHHRPSDGW